MWSTGVLNCVGIDSYLMNLAGEVSVAVFIPEHFRVQVPALVARVVVVAGVGCLAGGHPQSATGTNGFLRPCHETKVPPLRACRTGVATESHPLQRFQQGILNYPRR